MAPRTRLASALACSAIAALATAAPAAASHCPDAQTLASEQTTAQIEASLHCLVNERRAEGGLGGVRFDSRLRTAAERHSQDMVTQGYFAHDAPSGQNFISRIVATGYTRRASSWLVGENLVWGTATMSTPESMVQAWMDSPTHRANLLRGRFRDVGIAAVRGTPYDATDADGITVSSEYGVRKDRKSGGRGARASKKKARAAKKRRAARRNQTR
jgi:uncharacterized protein YkwD